MSVGTPRATCYCRSSLAERQLQVSRGWSTARYMMSNESRIASTERALSESHVYMSKADMVTGALRELVLGGELEPGEPLPQ